MEKLVYVDRRNTNCNKWDGQQKMFGEEGLHAMWVADMDFRVPECVVSALREYRSEERRVGKECRSRWSPYH